MKSTSVFISCCLVVALATPGLPKLPEAHTHNKPSNTAVAYPWVFEKGNETSHGTAVKAAQEILQKAGYAPIPSAVAESTWTQTKLATPTFGHLPNKSALKAYGKALKSSKILYGSVSWHTRSIWVNAGPKTISTATISVFVFDVASGKTVYSRKGVTGRSDEKSNGYKIAADILLSPLVTAVSGGPATPQEQRAVQIGMGLALHDWVVASKKRN